MRSLDYDGWLMVEAFSTAVQPLARKAKVWRDIYDSSEQLARDAVGFTRDVWDAA